MFLWLIRLLSLVLYELGALDILVGLVEALEGVNDGAARKYLRIEQLL